MKIAIIEFGEHGYDGKVDFADWYYFSAEVNWEREREIADLKEHYDLVLEVL